VFSHLVITSKSKELLKEEIKPMVEQFLQVLQERGLELYPTKTVITHVEQPSPFRSQKRAKALVKSLRSLYVSADGRDSAGRQDEGISDLFHIRVDSFHHETPPQSPWEQ
jgi:hypothetical protein